MIGTRPSAAPSVARQRPPHRTGLRAALAGAFAVTALLGVPSASAQDGIEAWGLDCTGSLQCG